MEKQQVYVGSVVAGSGGQVQDTRRLVEFEAEQLGKYTLYGQNREGGITDTRGETQTLYRTADGRLVVHIDNWSHWQGEPSVETLHEVTADDLGADGQFCLLGAECGMGRPLTLSDALTPSG